MPDRAAITVTTNRRKPTGSSRFRTRGWKLVDRELYGADYDKFTWHDESLHIEARDGRKLVGYAELWIEGGVIVIDELLVHEQYRSRGVGSRMMAKIEAVGRQRGAHKISLETDPTLEPANSFYRRHGFRKEATLPRHYAKRPAIMYGKRLD